MRTDQQAVRLTLYAPKGRMGKAIAAAAETDPDFTIDENHGDVLIDFSSPDGLRGSLDQAISAGVPILVGTTGLTEGHLDLITDAAETIPILVAPNTSLGVAETPASARSLPPETEIRFSFPSAKKAMSFPSGDQNG